jgi:hypothetical protein
MVAWPTAVPWRRKGAERRRMRVVHAELRRLAEFHRTLVILTSAFLGKTVSKARRTTASTLGVFDLPLGGVNGASWERGTEI